MQSRTQLRTTIQVSEASKVQLLKIKGDLLKKDGVDRTYDDVIQELIYYWIEGKKKTGYNIARTHVRDL